ncbi:hypothetical protein DFH06DRAFT_1130601 [Mycena polygramma]|nr:hypothetical protein DFH06DRAFT_1130601 [Mycena polygramma]
MHTFISGSILFLCAIAAAPGTFASALQRRCSDFVLNPNEATLAFKCAVGDQEISLNDCIGNDNGQLVSGSGLSSSCTELDFDGNTGVLSAACRANDGSTVATTFDLDKLVLNGFIVCTPPAP